MKLNLFLLIALSCNLVIFSQNLLIQEIEYFQNTETKAFKVVVDGREVGSVLCDLLPNNHLYLSPTFLDTELCTIGLIKEILFNLFESNPKTKLVSIAILDDTFELASILKKLGFTQAEMALASSSEKIITYQLKVPFKCKICDLLYPNVWENEQDDEPENREQEEEDFEY